MKSWARLQTRPRIRGAGDTIGAASRSFSLLSLPAAGRLDARPAGLFKAGHSMTFIERR